VAVVGVPDDKWGEQVVAFIRLAPGAELKRPSEALEQELHAFVRERLAPQKTPREWFFLDELPTTASGKVQKFALREQYIAEHS
jgi:acyl-coenzyme A synthetase/AMP-(fatty) acid ligase